MERVFYLCCAILSLVTIGVYASRCWRYGRIMEVGVLVNATMQSTGVVAGVLVVLGTFFPALRALLTGLDIYFFISGIAVLFVSSQGLKRDVWVGPRVALGVTRLPVIATIGSVVTPRGRGDGAE
jgi:hypothetical protein